MFGRSSFTYGLWGVVIRPPPNTTCGDGLCLAPGCLARAVLPLRPAPGRGSKATRIRQLPYTLFRSHEKQGSGSWHTSPSIRSDWPLMSDGVRGNSGSQSVKSADLKQTQRHLRCEGANALYRATTELNLETSNVLNQIRTYLDPFVKVTSTSPTSYEKELQIASHSLSAFSLLQVKRSLAGTQARSNSSRPL